MKSDVEYAIKELNAAAQCVASARNAEARDALTRFLFVLDQEPLGSLVQDLPIVDFAHWFEAPNRAGRIHIRWLGTQSLVGSRPLPWPLETAHRLAMQLALLRALSGGDISLDDFLLHFFHTGFGPWGRMDRCYHNFVSKIFQPFLRDLESMLEKKLAIKNHEQRRPNDDATTKQGSSTMSPLTILFLGANPSDATKLALQKEAQEIDTRLRSADLRDAFRIEQQWEVQANQLPGKIMRFKPHILHFSGHGDVRGELVFEDETGLAAPAGREVIAHLFSLLGSGIRCVVLNACFSSAQAEAIANHVDVVVGMSRAIGDHDAIKFAGAFYEALAYGKDVHTAFELAKLGIELANLPDGGVPELYCKLGTDPKHLVFAIQG